MFLSFLWQDFRKTPEPVPAPVLKAEVRASLGVSPPDPNKIVVSRQVTTSSGETRSLTPQDYHRDPRTGPTSWSGPLMGWGFENNKGSLIENIWPRLQQGTELKLKCEPDNPFDPNAVLVFTKTGKGSIGYLPAEVARYASQMVNDGVPYTVWISGAYERYDRWHIYYNLRFETQSKLCYKKLKSGEMKCYQYGTASQYV